MSAGRRIAITGGEAWVDEADHAAVVAAGPWHVKPGGRTVYASRNIRRENGAKSTQTLHLFLTGYEMADHIDGDGLNNRRSNLRPATSAQNARNRPVRSDSRSGFKGVFPNPSPASPWRAQIHIDGRKVHLGCFADVTEAALAYDRAAREAWGPFARFNFPTEGEQAA